MDLLFIPIAFATFLGLKVVQIHRFESLNKLIRTTGYTICVTCVCGFMSFTTVIVDH